MRMKNLLIILSLLFPLGAVAQEAYAVFNNGTLTFYYDKQSGYYYISSINVDVYDSNFKNIYSIRNCILSGIEKQSGALVVMDITFSDPNNYTGHYTVYPVTYDQLISLTDDYLSGYEPDERVKEKYSLG